ncbi:MAG: FAD:protein FMN transferase [Roseivirga sp.]|nr:FAD:protein FMN transferase [Roseivirga sp.]
MDKRNIRSRLYALVLLISIIVVYKYREANNRQEMHLTGTTMGTIAYNIKYLDGDDRNFKKEIDSLLIDFNQALSTYIPNSEISLLNRESKVNFGFPYFAQVLQASAEVYEKSNGAFDPTIGQLIDAWGFGDGGLIAPDSAQVDSLLNLVGFDKISFDETGVSTKVKGLKLNFSAVAKGQAIDVVGDYLAAQGIEDYMVEIGGEVRAKGKNKEDEYWTIGIEVPDENRVGGLFDAVRLKSQGMATSGNYRNFKVLEDGRKVAHTIDPKTGYPKMQTLLSATVFAPNCMYADAYATACLAMGLEGARRLILSDESLEAYFIYAGDDGKIQTYISPGMKDQVVSLDEK